MVRFTKKKINYYLASLLLFILSGCANQLPPSGGPLDKTPPKILKVYPENGTTNFKDDYFEIAFSKYVQKRSVQDAIFISPAIPGVLELDWSGKSVRVNFPSKLKENTTYVINIGTDVVSYYEKNRMAQSFTLTFSTGPKINHGQISGRVYANNPEGILLYAYEKGDSTINPAKRKPDYISQTGVGGTYQLLGLGTGTYRIFAVKDASRDLIYQSGQDEIGVPSQDVEISSSDSTFTGLDYFLTTEDTVKPRLLSANMLDANHILLDCTKELDTTVISSNNFFVFDSTTNTTIKPIYAFKGNTKPTQMVLVTNSKFTDGNNYYLFANILKDKLGNVYKNDFSSMDISSKTDTVKPSIYKTDPMNGADNADFIGQSFKFYFNDAFDSAEAKRGISFSDTSGRNVGFNIYFINDASFEIEPKVDLKPNTYYVIKINLAKIKDAAGNSADTVYKYKFKTINGLDFTGVSGDLLNIDSAENPVVVLQSAAKTYRQKPKSNNQFNFDRVDPGKYFLWCFMDKDSSGTYSYGKDFPYKPAERFSFYPDTLDLKARWKVTDVKLYFIK
jgi:Bacterial Ig-like domain